MQVELERIAALNTRVQYLESEVRSLRSNLLEQEADISELKEKIHALSIDNGSARGVQG